MSLSIADYLKKVQALNFEEHPYSEVDLIPLIEMTYLPIERWVPTLTAARHGQHAKPITLAELYQQFAAHEAAHCHKYPLLVTDYRCQLFEQLAKNPRYRDIQFSYLHKKLDHRYTMQFTALVVTLPQVAEQIIIFRGSTASLLSWEENALLATETTVAAQIEALYYLQALFEQLPGPFTIAGHSKGGNLAFFAALFSDYEDARSPFITAKKRLSSHQIKHVYNFDGPGLSRDCFQQVSTHPLRQRLTKYIPESAVIGNKLQQVVTSQIVASRSFSIFQHDMHYWQVDEDTLRLEKAASVTALSSIFDEVYRQWTQEFEPLVMQRFYLDFFKMLEALGYQSFHDIEKDGLDFLKRAKAYYDALDPEEKAPFKQISRRFLEIFQEKLLDYSDRFAPLSSAQTVTDQLSKKYHQFTHRVETALHELFPPWS